MRKVVEAALPLLAGRGYWAGRGGRGRRIGAVVRRRENFADITIRLVNAQRADPGVSRVGEDVTHVLKQNKAERVSEEGKNRWREPHFGAVDQGAGAANWKTGLRISRT